MTPCGNLYPTQPAHSQHIRVNVQVYGRINNNVKFIIFYQLPITAPISAIQTLVIGPFIGIGAHTKNLEVPKGKSRCHINRAVPGEVPPYHTHPKRTRPTWAVHPPRAPI